MSASHSVCLSVSVYLSASQPLSLFACLSASLPLTLSVCLAVEQGLAQFGFIVPTPYSIFEYMCNVCVENLHVDIYMQIST